MAGDKMCDHSLTKVTSILLATLTIAMCDEASVSDNIVSSKVSNKEAYDIAIRNVKEIKRICGDLCRTESSQSDNISQGKFYPHLKKKMDCQKLWSPSVIDEMSHFDIPPARIPKSLRSDFTYGNTIPIEYVYYDDLEVEHKESNVHGKLFLILNIKNRHAESYLKV